MRNFTTAVLELVGDGIRILWPTIKNGLVAALVVLVALVALYAGAVVMELITWVLG